MMRTTQKRLLIFMPATALLAAAGIWYLYNTQAGKTFLPPCLFLRFTGLYCTGCGMTRATWYLLHGQFYAALRMNALGVVSLPFILWFVALCLVRIWQGRPLPNLPTWVPWLVLGLIVAFTVARNLPWAPFSWLAPTVVPAVGGVPWVRLS